MPSVEEELDKSKQVFLVRLPQRQKKTKSDNQQLPPSSKNQSVLSSMPSPNLKLDEPVNSRTPTKSSYDLAERERTRLNDVQGPSSPLRRHAFQEAAEEHNDRNEDHVKRHTVADSVPRTPRTPTTAVPIMPNHNSSEALKNAERENDRLKRELELVQHRLERPSSRSSSASRGLERSTSERSSRSGTPSRAVERERESDSRERVVFQSRDSSVASERLSRPSTPSRALDALEKERERLARDSDAQRSDRHSRPSTPSSLALQVEPLEFPALRIRKESDAHRTATVKALERGASRPSTPSRGLERRDSESRRRDGSPKVKVLIVTPSDEADEELDRETYRPITFLESGERERAGLKREIDALKGENLAVHQALEAVRERDQRSMRELEILKKEAEKLTKENEKYSREMERHNRRMSMEGRTADALALAEHENDRIRDQLEDLRISHARCEIELQETVMAAEQAHQDALAAIPKAPAYINPDMIMTAGLHQVKALNEGIRRLSHNIAAGLEWDRDAYAGYNARGNYNWRDKALLELTPFLGEQSIRYIKSQLGAPLPLPAMQAFVQVLLVTFCDWKLSTWLSTDATLADLFSQHKQGSGNRSVEPNDVPVYNVLRWRGYIHEQFSNLVADDAAVTGHQMHRRQEFDGILNRLRTTGPWRFKVDRTIISSLFAGLLQNLDDLKQTFEAGTASLLSYPGGYGVPSSEPQDSYRLFVLWLAIPGSLVRENLVDVQGNVNANYDEVILGNGGFGFGSLLITSPDKRASIQSATSSTSRVTKKCRLEFMHNYNCLPPVVVERSLPFLGGES